MNYQTKSKLVKAIQWNGVVEQLANSGFDSEPLAITTYKNNSRILVYGKGHNYHADIGDYIVQYTQGDIIVIPQGIFESLFSIVKTEPERIVSLTESDKEEIALKVLKYFVATRRI